MDIQGITLPRVLAVMVDPENHLLVTSDRDVRRIGPSELFSVVVVWDVMSSQPWRGWLTTRDRWAVSFGFVHLLDGKLLGWLRALPAWNPAAWRKALDAPGIHLVWRSRDLPACDPLLDRGDIADVSSAERG